MPHFDLVAMVDWSAASTPGPKRPAEDKIWIAWGGPGHRPPPAYCRTREEAFERLAALVSAVRGSALVGFDFPNAYPSGSGLGGGRRIAALLASRIEDGPDNRNNRFEVARTLNRRLGRPPGPFWMCPAARADHTLTVKKPDFAGRGFAEYRLVERRLQTRGRWPQSVWKLGGVGSVGSQALTGLPVVHRLLELPGLKRRSRIWPFETGWDRRLDGIVYAEIWPSLYSLARQRHPIKDARQVAAVRDTLLAWDGTGTLRRYLARPRGLGAGENRLCLAEEGWILGVE